MLLFQFLRCVRRQMLKGCSLRQRENQTAALSFSPTVLCLVCTIILLRSQLNTACLLFIQFAFLPPAEAWLHTALIESICFAALRTTSIVFSGVGPRPNCRYSSRQSSSLLLI